MRRKPDLLYRPRRLPTYQTHNVQLPVPLYERLAREAFRRRVSRATVIREMLERELPQ